MRAIEPLLSRYVLTSRSHCVRSSALFISTRCMFACSRDWFHGERKHVEEPTSARVSREEEVDTRHTRERELSVHVAHGDPWINPARSGSLVDLSFSLLSYLWWPSLITNRAFGNLYASDVTVLFHRCDGIDVYRTDIGVESVRRMHGPYFIGGSVPILRDSALTKGRPRRDTSSSTSYAATSDFRIRYLASFLFLVDLHRSEVNFHCNAWYIMSQ